MYNKIFYHSLYGSYDSDITPSWERLILNCLSLFILVFEAMVNAAMIYVHNICLFYWTISKNCRKIN